jgi:hypothetical protein
MTDKESILGNKDHLFNKYGIVVNVVPGVGLYISGAFMANHDLLKQFAPKFLYILETIKQSKSKVLIFHNVICSTTGVYAI